MKCWKEVLCSGLSLAGYCSTLNNDAQANNRSLLATSVAGGSCGVGHLLVLGSFVISDVQSPISLGDRTYELSDP